MLKTDMDTPRQIEREAWDFFRLVIDKMNDRPAKFKTDKEMAMAARVKTSTFTEYKLGTKGHDQPNFITIYKLAHVIRGRPPCTIEPDNLALSRFQDALKKAIIYLTNPN
jgi:hypothetical protein